MRLEFFHNNIKKVLKTPRNLNRSQVFIENKKWAIYVTVRKITNKEAYHKKVSLLGNLLLSDKLCLKEFLYQKEKAYKRLKTRKITVRLIKDPKTIVTIQKGLFELS